MAEPRSPARGRIVQVVVPNRVDLAGGTLDIFPLYLLLPGAMTVNAAIRMASTVSILPVRGPVRLVSDAFPRGGGPGHARLPKRRGSAWSPRPCGFPPAPGSSSGSGTRRPSDPGSGRRPPFWSRRCWRWDAYSGAETGGRRRGRRWRSRRPTSGTLPDPRITSPRCAEESRGSGTFRAGRSGKDRAGGTAGRKLAAHGFWREREGPTSRRG